MRQMRQSITGMMQKRDYTEFYNKITRPFRHRPWTVSVLKAADKVLAGGIFLFYPVMLVILFRQAAEAKGAIGMAVAKLLPDVLVPGIAFVLLSIVRGKFNAKRPYEEWQIEVLIMRDGSGHSMPSRHVFSAAVIAMCALRHNLYAGVVLLILAGVIAVIRVLGGVHYPKDVAAGYVVGVAAGLLLWVRW